MEIDHTLLIELLIIKISMEIPILDKDKTGIIITDTQLPHTDSIEEMKNLPTKDIIGMELLETTTGLIGNQILKDFTIMPLMPKFSCKIETNKLLTNKQEISLEIDH